MQVGNPEKYISESLYYGIQNSLTFKVFLLDLNNFTTNQTGKKKLFIVEYQRWGAKDVVS